MVDILHIAESGTLARIAYVNDIDAGTLSASSSDSDHPVDLVADNRWDRRWKPTSAGTALITATFAAREVSMWACYGHNLATALATVTPEVQVGGSWVAFGTPFIPSTNGVIYRTPSTVTATGFRLSVTTASVVPEIGILWCGSELLPPVGLTPGSDIPLLSRLPVITDGRNDAGVNIAPTIDYYTADCSFTFQNMPDSYALDEWLAFHQACGEQRKPFFIHRNYLRDPNGAAFCHDATFNTRPSNYHHFVNSTISCQAET
jgi:hypothetical protein